MYVVIVYIVLCDGIHSFSDILLCDTLTKAV